MEIKTFKTDLLAEKGGEALTDILCASGKKETLLLLAGGSSMGMLQYVGPETLGPHLTVTMLDERFSADPKICNFLQLKTLPFYEWAAEAAANVFDTSPQEGETIDELAARWETMLREWTAGNPNGAVISTFGIGEDGHICGIMPHPDNPQRFKDLFENDGRWVAGYDAGANFQFPLRVTTTFSFLRKYLTAGAVFVAGGKKRSALRKLLAPQGALPETPARILNELPSITLFTDLTVPM